MDVRGASDLDGGKVMLRKVLIAAGLLVLLTATGGAALARATPAQKCALKKIKAVAKKAQLKLKCYAKAAVKGAVDPKCIAKAEAKFDKLFTKAESKGGCATSGDEQALEDKVDAFVADVVSELPAGSPSGAFLDGAGGLF